MLSTSASVVAGVRKQAAPRVKQLKQTVPVPRTKWVKRYVEMPKRAASGKQRQTSVDDDARLRQQQQQLAAVKLKATLPNQQTI